MPLLNVKLFKIEEHSKCTKLIFGSIRSEYSIVNFYRKKCVNVLKRLLKVVSKAILCMLLASAPDLCLLSLLPNSATSLVSLGVYISISKTEQQIVCAV